MKAMYFPSLGLAAVSTAFVTGCQTSGNVAEPVARPGSPRSPPECVDPGYGGAAGTRRPRGGAAGPGPATEGVTMGLDGTSRPVMNPPSDSGILDRMQRAELLKAALELAAEEREQLA